jgi:glutathione S-transferase
VIKLYHAPLSRSVRIVWLFEELGIPYELQAAPLVPPAPRPFAQNTPTGKVPTIEDDGVAIFESGAILEYILEKYGNGRLAPAVGSASRGPFLQWVHFAEATLFTGLGNIAWHRRYKQDAEAIADAVRDYQGWTEACLASLERQLDGKPFVLGADFSGADIMLGYSLLVAKAFGALGESFPLVNAYLGRLTERPALRTALRS